MSNAGKLSRNAGRVRRYFHWLFSQLNIHPDVGSVAIIKNTLGVFQSTQSPQAYQKDRDPPVDVADILFHWLCCISRHQPSQFAMSSIPRGSDLSAISGLSQAPNVSLEKPQDILKAQPKSVIITIKRAVSINDVGSKFQPRSRTWRPA